MSKINGKIIGITIAILLVFNIVVALTKTAQSQIGSRRWKYAACYIKAEKACAWYDEAYYSRTMKGPVRPFQVPGSGGNRPGMFQNSDSDLDESILAGTLNKD
jgi:hypothetical protein